MIWALLEITLPLCLAFLLGITGGWLFWRWRRRYVQASEWEDKSSSVELTLLRAEYDELKETSKMESATLRTLEGKLNSQTAEMRAMDSAATALSDKLKDANEKPAAEPLAIDNSAELKKLKTQLADEKNNVQDTLAKNIELSDKAEKQSKLNTELQQKLKQTETVTIERDSAIERIKELETQLSRADGKDSELTGAKDELSAVQLKFKNFQASVVADRQNNDQDKQKLQSRIELLESELKDQAAQTAASTDDKDKISQLQSQLLEMNKLSAELDQTKTSLTDSKTETVRQSVLITELQSKLQNARQRSESDNTETQSKLSDLEKQLAEAKAIAPQLNQAKSTIAASSEENTRLRSQISDLESQLKAANNNADNDDKLQALEQQLIQANSAASELNKAKASISTLNTQLNEARMKIAQNSQAHDNLATANSRNNELMLQNEELKKNSSNPEARQELRDLQKKHAEVTAELNEEKKRTATAKTPVTSITTAQLKKLKAQNKSKDERIAALEKKLKNKSAKRKQKHTWQKGTTKLGTPGSDHKDDLTIINGIGPKIEKVLNKLGIKSIEQLAFLRATEVSLVDEALEDFPGRIKRDEWVPQAKEILKRGHQPLNKKLKTKSKSTKKPKRNKPAKNAWQQGETRFGTPGSIHRDDLKVINGIGPVIETALNRRGVRSWEQLATLKAADVKTIDEALDFPGRIKREKWVQQAKSLVKKFPDHKTRPNRTTFLNKVANG